MNPEGDLFEAARPDPRQGVVQGGAVREDARARHDTGTQRLENPCVAPLVGSEIIGVDDEPLHGSLTPAARIRRFRKTYSPPKAS